MERFSINDIKNIVDQYINGEGSPVISRQYNVSVGTILKILRNNNISIRLPHQYQLKYPIQDESFFKHINNEYKSYILGLIFADGYNDIKKQRVSIALAEQDLDILYKIRKFFQPDKPITCEYPKNKNHQNMYRLQICSSIICKDLENLGCTQCKTFKLLYPNIPDYLSNHFIRGYFDGDGCIHIRKKYNQPRFLLVGTESLLLSIQQILVKNTGINKNKLYNSTNCKFLKILEYGGTQNVKKIRFWLYNNATIYLQRKYNKMFSF